MNASINYMPFNLNYSYHPRNSYKDINPYSRFKEANKLANNVKNLMTSCKKNFYHRLSKFVFARFLELCT